MRLVVASDLDCKLLVGSLRAQHLGAMVVVAADGLWSVAYCFDVYLSHLSGFFHYLYICLFNKMVNWFNC